MGHPCLPVLCEVNRDWLELAPPPLGPLYHTSLNNKRFKTFFVPAKNRLLIIWVVLGRGHKLA